MSENEIQIPDFFDVSEDAIKAADNAMDPTPKPPKNATKTVDKKTGDEYFRWTEALTLDQIESSKSPKGHTMILIRGKIKALGAPTDNVGKRVFSRYTINFPVLMGTVKDDGLEAMNTRSIAALKSLLISCGYWPDTNRMTAALMKTCFPPQGMPPSPLLGKVVMGNLVDSKNKGEGAKRDRDVKAETYLPAPTA